VRVRLHRARLFVRKELAQQHSVQRVAAKAAAQVSQRPAVPVHLARPASCKAMFAELSDYLDEQLDDSVCEKLEQHIEDCDACKAFLSSLETTIDRLRKIPRDRLSLAIAAKLRAKLLAQLSVALNLSSDQVQD
jgi:hypothetical protein